MRTLLRAAAFLFGLLILSLAWRTYSLKTPSAAEQVREQPADLDSQIIARHLGEAIRFETISHDEGADEQARLSSHAAFVGLHGWIQKSYPHVAATLQRELIGDSLLYTWAGRDAKLPPILLMAHADVVPVVPGSEKDWLKPPFSGAVSDGFVWGRGALDDKAPMVAILEATEALLAKGFQPERSILLAFGHDEEIGGHQGNQRIAERLQQRNVRLAWVLDEGGFIGQGMVPGMSRNAAFVGVAEKGYLSVRLTAKTLGGHSSVPPALNQTAIGQIAEALNRIGQQPFALRLDDTVEQTLAALAPYQNGVRRLVFANQWLFAPLTRHLLGNSKEFATQMHTTIAPTIIQGGVKDNVLPPSAEAVLNLRIHPRDTQASVLEHLRQAIADLPVQVQPLPGGWEPSTISNTDSAGFKLLDQTIRQTFANTVVIPNLTAAATDSRHYLGLADQVFRFAPRQLPASELAGVHGANERISVENLALMTGFYHRLIQAQR